VGILWVRQRPAARRQHPDTLPRVLDGLAALDPGVLVPAHCTGSRPARHVGPVPRAYVPDAVGTGFLL
jgi:metal-dependent hydrolase (beta-lactamase superfamily II)